MSIVTFLLEHFALVVDIVIYEHIMATLFEMLAQSKCPTRKNKKM